MKRINHFEFICFPNQKRTNHMSRTIKDSKKAPLCKGGWIFAKQKDWGIVKCRYLTILPSKIKDFCHLPLHKGGFLFCLIP